MTIDGLAGTEARITRLELQIAIMSEQIDRLFRENAEAGPDNARAQPPGTAEHHNVRGPKVPTDSPPRAAHSAFRAKSAEWWLARGGALLTILALILMYDYAVDRNWITPLVRVVIGTALGSALMLFGNRVAPQAEGTRDDTVGLREVLMGAALAAWFITAYAAGVWYELVPLSASRAVFLAVSVGGAWLALRERRAILAMLSLGAGFAAPALLPSDASSTAAFSLFIGALTAVGLVLYLMRGWQSVLCLTFIAFWWNAGQVADAVRVATSGSAVPASAEATIPLTLLIVVAAAAFVRVPTLRRRLLGIGSDLYTQPRRSAAVGALLDEWAVIIQRFTGQAAATDSPALWTVTVASPLIALSLLPELWPAVSDLAWSGGTLAIGFLAWRLASSPRTSNDEVTHVEAFAAALWTLVGLMHLALPVARALHMPDDAARLVFASLHAVFILWSIAPTRFRMPVHLARATVAAALLFVVSYEMFSAPVTGPGILTSWNAAEVISIAAGLWVWWKSQRHDQMLRYAAWFGALSYAALMLVDNRVLGAIWSPLVTASYAAAGAALLIMSRSAAHRPALRRAGGFTLVVVVARLLVVDLAGVETIWRVLLFFVCGGLFLFTSHQMQQRQSAAAM